jgi:hypothetical protein
VRVPLSESLREGRAWTINLRQINEWDGGTRGSDHLHPTGCIPGQCANPCRAADHAARPATTTARRSGPSTRENDGGSGGFFDLGNFRAVGELATLAVGVNFVLVRDRLEVGGCWSTPLYARRDFDFNSMLLKMIVRF